MRKLLLLLAFLAAPRAFALDAYNGGNPCMDPSIYLQTASGQTSGTTLTQVIPLVTGQQIYICSLAIQGVSGTTPTLSWSYGTGANCGTGTTTLIPSMATAAGAFFPFPMPVTKVPAGKALCYQGGGTTPVQNYVLTYVQK